MARRLVCLMVLASLLFALTPLVSAEPREPKGQAWPKYATLNTDRSFDAGSAIQREREARKKHEDYLQKLFSESGAAVPLGEDPGVGATRVVVSRWSSGYTYQDDEKSGIASAIWNIALTILSYFTTTAGQIMLDVAQLFGDGVNTSQGATTRLYHSFSYPDKLAQVWTANRVWQTYFTSSTREWYRHEFASYTTTAGFTRTGTRDYTPEQGASPYRIEYATHYFDDTWLQNEAWYRWYYNMAPGYEYGYY